MHQCKYLTMPTSCSMFPAQSVSWPFTFISASAPIRIRFNRMTKPARLRMFHGIFVGAETTRQVRDVIGCSNLGRSVFDVCSQLLI